MNPQSNRAPRKWTPAENKILQAKVEECKKSGKPIYWPQVAAAFRDRSKDDCRKRWAKMDEKWRKGAWDSSEDDILCQAVKEYGCRWTDISKTIGTRSPDQCAKRWRNSLNPNNSRGEWTEEDDTTLMEAVQSYGHDWKLIHEKFLPDRSRLDLSNRYVSLARQQKKKQPRPSTTSSTTMHSQDNHAQAESEQMHDLIPTSPENGKKQHDPFLQTISTTSMDDQAITSWISQGARADPMEVLDPQLFPGALGQYGPRIPQAHDDLFTTMNPYSNNESDKTRSVLMSPNSSSSLFPFPNATMSFDSWMNLSPTTTSRALSSTNDRQQQPPAGGLEGQATLTDANVTEAVTPSSSNGIQSVVAPGERGKTVLTLENLDPDTRSDVLDLLFRRKIVTTIAIV